jgi:outer membrane protein assembly factor BamB
VLCFDRESGDLLWQTIVHQGKATPPRNERGTQASSTVACDGRRLFINFLHDGAMYTSALSLEGERLWQTKIDDYVVHQGYGSSPAVYGPLVIVSADNKSGGAVAGLDRRTGQVVWKIDRPQSPNYASPVILDVAGRTQLLMIGCDLVSSREPLTGETLWEIEGATTECVTSTVADGDLIYTSGGYPRNHVSAVRADGSGEIVWENGSRVYVPSMLARDGYLYAVMDGGVAVCWKADSGEELWKGRLGGTFSSSPVLVGDRIYATNEAGETFIFQASPHKFELTATSKLGDECFATPAICGSRIYARVAHELDGARREYLYCVAEDGR